jgi:hypothetical protein
VNELDDLNELERELGALLRSTLQRRADDIADAEPPPLPSPSRNGHSRRPVQRLAPIVVERRIGSARRRPRLHLIIAGTVAAAIVAIVAVALVVASRIERIETIVPAAAPTTVDPETAVAAGTSELVASMYVHHTLDRSGDLWLYLYADGRLITASAPPVVPPPWREQRLTPLGALLVRDDIISSGLFDPDHPPPGSGAEPEGIRARIQVRNGDRLAYLVWEPDRAWSPEFVRRVERLRSLESWLPAIAWADVEARPYVPDRYAICTAGPGSEPPGWSHVVPLFPAAAAAIVNAAAPLDEITGEVDALHERSGGDSGCLDLTRAQAQNLAESLDAEFPPNRTFTIPIDAENTLLFIPVLPHGVPDCACGG